MWPMYDTLSILYMYAIYLCFKCCMYTSMRLSMQST